MHYTGTTYRPPFESESLLLQVTVGCSHNNCTFCSMYRDVQFKIESLEQIAADLDEAKRFYPFVDRVFLVNGDAFVLSADRLTAIAELIHEKLPRVETIGMYASVRNVMTKTDAELKALRALGITELNMGTESGLDEALTFMNKGFTAEESITQLLRLKAAGIDFCTNVIFGGAGPELRIENAIKTAELVNKTQPYTIFTETIHGNPGSPLHELMKEGKFIESTIGQYLEEELTFLRHLNVENCRYFGLHPSNIVQLQGWLSQDRDKIISVLEQVEAYLSPEQLAMRPTRMSEGSVTF